MDNFGRFNFDSSRSASSEIVVFSINRFSSEERFSFCRLVIVSKDI